MKKPHDMVSTPNGKWYYKQPESGMEFRENHPRALEGAVFQHRLNLPALNMDVTGGWEARLWSDVCQQNPHLPCDDTETVRAFPNLTDLWHFIQTMWNWRRAGGGFVTKEEAERRASVCLTGANGHPCPHNEVFTPCLGCKGFSEEIGKLVEGRTTSQDQQLHMCSACGGCKISTKVHFPLEAISVDQNKLPPWCWQRKP